MKKKLVTVLLASSMVATMLAGCGSGSGDGTATELRTTMKFKALKMGDTTITVDSSKAYLYSDEAAKIFAASNAIQPIQGMSAMLSDENKLFYSIYDNGAVAVMDSFATTDPVEGITVRTTFFDPVNSLVTGDKTEDDWIAQIKSDSDQLRAALK